MQRADSRVGNIELHMGEAPAIINLKSKGCQTLTTVGDKTYVIGEGSALSIGVEIFDKSRGGWVDPIVLGTKPNSRKGHSAVLLGDDRILIVKRGSAPDDCIWFLEVDTKYVREQKKILGTEVVAWSKGSLGEAEKPVVISGPSGVGKGTLISMLMKEFPSMFGFSVSHTTRAPRATEKDGIHYHFTDRRVMEKDIEDEKFLEFASVHGNLYGTSIEAVEVVADIGKICILDIDVQGARSVRDSSLEAVFIFICPPSVEELEKRLRARGTETEDQIVKRIQNAKEELEQGKSPGLFDHVLYNDNLEDCYQNLKKILGLASMQVSAQIESTKGIDLPVAHSVSKIDKKILIKYGTSEKEMVKNCIVMDMSSIRGGAPGRTRGLNIYANDSLSDGLNEIHLS